MVRMSKGCVARDLRAGGDLLKDTFKLQAKQQASGVSGLRRQDLATLFGVVIRWWRWRTWTFSEMLAWKASRLTDSASNPLVWDATEMGGRSNKTLDGPDCIPSIAGSGY